MTKNKVFISLITLIMAFALPATSVAGGANAQGLGKGKGVGQGKGLKVKGFDKAKPFDNSSKKFNKGFDDTIGPGNSGKKADKPKFSTNDRSKISRFLDENAIPSNSLPPGIQMNVARGKPLPPGIEKVYLPDSLRSQLPNFPGYDYVVVGDDIVLIDNTNDIVADILSDIIRNQ